MIGRDNLCEIQIERRREVLCAVFVNWICFCCRCCCIVLSIKILNYDPSQFQLYFRSDEIIMSGNQIKDIIISVLEEKNNREGHVSDGDEVVWLV